MKKLLALAAAVGGVFFLVNKRKQNAAAEARLWDEATGVTSPTVPARPSDAPST